MQLEQSFTALEVIGSGGIRSLEGSPFGASGEFSSDGLLHDARNLVSAIGLYCDLLSMPGVLKPEHRKYSDELRLLGTRSQQMIEHLMHSLAGRRRVTDHGEDFVPAIASPERTRPPDDEPGMGILTGRAAAISHVPVSLRSIVERCSGLLSRVASGRPIEILYGPAAAMPIRIPEEWVERILVNLVRNGSAALGEGHAAIRIQVGPLDRAVGEAQAWPFARLRLVVEDAGCGMEPRQLEALLTGRGPAPRGNHGIGFRVVRELVAASGGELRAASARGIGTRIQIEWPVAALTVTGRGEDRKMNERAVHAEQNPAGSHAIAHHLQTAAAAGERQGAH